MRPYGYEFTNKLAREYPDCYDIHIFGMPSKCGRSHSKTKRRIRRSWKKKARNYRHEAIGRSYWGV